MPTNTYIACDLGAESGRVILGTFEGGTLALDEVHRFANGPTRIAGSFRWNVLGIYEQILVGLQKVARRGVQPAGISVDSWGVDYVLLGDGQPLLGQPHHYRDPRTDATYAEALQQFGRERIFAETGIQFMAINTLYQLLADRRQSPQLLALADRFLNMADYLNYLLSGVDRAEVSLASTTQLYNPTTGTWATELITDLHLPARMFPEIVPSGTVLGPLAAEVAEATGLADVPVIASCSHDTGAAVAAVPAEGDDWAYLSSGTWSLVGVELPEPLVIDAAREHNFTNEAGFGGTTRFLKNIIGLWLLQESRRAWEREGQSLDYEQLNQLAAEAPAFRSLVNPNAARFMQPDDMPAKIAAYCRETGQPAPETPGQFTRCILESLALLYGQSLADLERLTGRTIRKLHIVGGGSQSALLNQFTASATGRTVLTGPVEATAVGNVLIQAIATGALGSLAELRQVVRNSQSIETYEPHEPDAWLEASQRFAELELSE